MNKSDSKTQPPATAPSTRTSRVVVAMLVATLFLTLAWADATGLGGSLPAWWLLPIAILLAVGGIDELVRLFALRNLLLPGWLLRIGAIAIPLAAAFGSQAFEVGANPSAASPVVALGWALVAFTAAMASLFLHEILCYREQSRAIERLSAGVLGLAFIGLPLAFIVGLRLLCVAKHGSGQTALNAAGIIPLVSLVAVVKVGDIAAYSVGSLVGRHRLVPILSPGKTWEGAAASLAGSLVAAWLVLEGLGWDSPWQPLGGWITFGFVVGVAGMCGDLAESLFKRELRAKDSGRSLGGLGGVLDLIDSLLLAAPVAWFLWVQGT